MSEVKSTKTVDSSEQIVCNKLVLVIIGLWLKVKVNWSEPVPSQFPETVFFIMYIPYDVKFIAGNSEVEFVPFT